MKKQLQSAILGSKILVMAMLLIGMQLSSSAQTPIPFEIKNTSDYADDQLFVAIVGISNGRHVWVDMTNGQQKDMSPSYNTVSGPIYGGNKGPGTNGMYANCFTKLSNIPNKKINLQGIEGCRAFISVKSQLYFYFFGATGAQQGYTSPSSTDPTDPNTGIKYEIIELSYNTLGFWGNTTRVDGYQYPMGLEVTSANGAVTKTGELKSHADIGAAFKASVPTEFQGCYDPASGSILFPTKTVAWADGSIGTMPNRGPYVDYMQSYIDQVWAKYRNEDLIFSSGDAGVFKGRVSGNQLTMTCISGGFNGRTGIVQNKPTTQEAFEGKGVFDRGIADVTVDLVVQAQLTAAFTRHLISLAANPGQQDWSKPATFYGAAPCNYYAKFWHRSDISLNGLSYGFAYDDVFSQSSTMYSGSPKSILVLFGGYAKSVPPTDPNPFTPSSDVVTAYYDCNYKGFSGGLKPGNYTMTQLAALGLQNDQISSIKIAQGYKAILYYDDNFTGATVELAADNGCFNDFWTDKVTSIKILTNGATNLAGTYYIQNRNSGLNLDVRGGTGATGDGARMQQWNVAKTTNQQFRLEHLGDGTYKITAVHSGKVMDVSAISKDNGAAVQQWTYYGTPNQQFIIVPTDNGFYKLIAKHSGKVVEVAGFSTALEANVQQWDNINQSSGQWKFVDLVQSTTDVVTAYYDCNFTGFSGGLKPGNYTMAQLAAIGLQNDQISSIKIAQGYKAILYYDDNFTGATVELTADNGCFNDFWTDKVTSIKILTNGSTNMAGTYYLQNRNSHLNLDVRGGTGATGDGAIMQQWNVATTSNQQFRFDHLGDGTYKITALHSGKVMDVSAISRDNGAVLHQWTYYGTPNQQFIVVPADNGFYKLIAKHSGKVVEVAGFSTALEANVQQWDNVNQTSGQWGFKVVTGAPDVNQAPSIVMTSPANGASYNAPASIVITANASDADGSISKVEFYNGATKIGEDATAPYAYTLINAGAGTYVISVKAIDNLGSVTASGSVSVTVVAVATDACTSLPTYAENAGYVAGSKVKIGGKQYECKEWPYSGWCNGASWAYEPGTGAYWTDAWYDRGTCSARVGNDDNAIQSSQSKSVVLAPNPTSGIVSIGLDKQATVSVYNAVGEVMIMPYQVEANGKLDVSNLSAGLYLVKIDTGTELIVQSLIKN